MNKKLKRVPAVFMAAVLVVGVAAGAGVWLLNVEVPIEYDEPYTISMSQSEVNDYDWETLQFREGHTLETADFGETGAGISYHQYVRVENPADTDPVNVEFQVNEPDEFENQMGFSILSGIVEPGDEGELGVDAWGSIEGNIAAGPGETEEVTVVYTLQDGGVPEGNEHDVIWDFYEGEYTTVDEDIVNAIDNAEEGDVIFVEEGDYEIDSTIRIEEEDVQLLADGDVTISAAEDADLDSTTPLAVLADGGVVSGFNFDDFLPRDGANAISVSFADNAVISHNTFTATLEDEDDEGEWSSCGVLVWDSANVVVKENTFDIAGNMTADVGSMGEQNENLRIEDNIFKGQRKEEGSRYVRDWTEKLDLEAILEEHGNTFDPAGEVIEDPYFAIIPEE